jgi:hypothetical protein
MCSFTRTGGSGSTSGPNGGEADMPIGVAGIPGSGVAPAPSAPAAGTTVSAAAQVKLAPSSIGWARRTRPAMYGLDKEVSLGIRLRG